MGELNHRQNQLSVQNIINLYNNGALNLSPGFQRDSVWSLSDRRKLIDSICRNYPLPAIFFRRRQENGEVVYDVIDGKQRLETVLMFTGAIRGRKFEVRLSLPSHHKPEKYDWQRLCRRNLQYLISGYDFMVIDVDGDVGPVIDLFVRINSTGKALTSAEKRHARYFHSDFLRCAAKLADKYSEYFQQNKILGLSQINRMKHVELMCELMISIHSNDVINRKRALDHVLAADSFTPMQVKKAAAKTVTILNRVKKIIPHLASTRFHKLSDFYTLVVLFAKFESDYFILTDKRRNVLARDILTVFSNGVDEVSELHKKAKPISPNKELYRQYLLTTLESTDEITNRRNRENILHSVLQSIYARKDKNRFFSLEQRRILWNTSATRKCKECEIQLTWEDFTIDHIDPYSKGGLTRLNNAALLCRKDNSSKRDRRTSK